MISVFLLIHNYRITLLLQPEESQFFVLMYTEVTPVRSEELWQYLLWAH